MSTPQSYHLPDLLSIVSTLPLRTNSHCRSASKSTERRILASGALSTHEEKLLVEGSMKLGLLMALCFPTCDRPQLELLCEAGIWVAIGGMRNVEGSVEGLPPGMWYELEDGIALGEVDVVDLLKKHKLLRQLRMFLLYSLHLSLQA